MEILYEDNHIIVVKKPAGVPSQADITNDLDMISLIKEYLREKYDKKGNIYVGLVHRLDRGVSGVMVFAKTSKAASRLSEEVRTRQIKKSYYAIVKGKMEEKSSILEDYLWKDQKKNISYVVRENKKNAKQAILEYELMEYNEKKDISLVKINLKTGRHHQIRVQFSSRKHPLVGDIKYNGKPSENICLLAYSLEFTHPVKREKMTFEISPDKKGFWLDFNSL